MELCDYPGYELSFLLRDKMICAQEIVDFLFDTHRGS